MNLEELRKRRNVISNDVLILQENLNVITEETNRVANVAHNAKQILDELDREFSRRTGLDDTDIAFLFVAIGLQCVRIHLVNQYTIIQNAGTGNTIEDKLHDAQSKILSKFDNGMLDAARPYYAPLNQIITIKGVPYDATAFLKEKYEIFKGANHRFSTLGHEPIMGLVFGTANILTNTISCFNKPILTTNHVVYTPEFKSPKIGAYASSVKMFAEVAERIAHDREAVVAALIKQIIHIGTDMYTPCGIQLPAINLVLSKKEIELLTKHIGMGDLVKAGASFGIASFIDLIIGTLHALQYQELKHGSRDMYRIKTNKILKYSNLIASSSNVIWVGINLAAGDKGAIRYLDIGGIINTVRRLYADKDFIRQVKEEFLFGSFNQMIQGDELKLAVLPER